MVLSLPEGAVSALLVEHGNPTTVVRVLDVTAAAAPLRFEDDRVAALVVLAYDRPLDELVVEPAPDGTVPLARDNEGDDGWALPTPTAWRAYDSAAGQIVDGTGADPLDARTAALALRRPRCGAITGYDSTTVRLDLDLEEVYLSALDRDVAMVAALHYPDDGVTSTATLTFTRAERMGGARRAERTLRTSTNTQVDALRDGEATWVVVGEPERTRLFTVDEDGRLTPDRVLEGDVDPRTLRVLRDGRWVGVGIAPPVVRVLRPGATAWEDLVGGAHRDPTLEQRCTDEELHPSLSLAGEAEAWVGAVGLGLFRVPLDRPSTWAALVPEALPEPGPFCSFRHMPLSGGAELVFVAGPGGRAESRVWWRRSASEPWLPLEQGYAPFNLHAHQGRPVGVSSNGFVDVFDYEPRRPDVPPRRCAQRPVVSTRARGFEDQLISAGDGGLRDQGISGVRVQWLELP